MRKIPNKLCNVLRCAKPLQSASVTLWTVACQAPLSTRFSSQEFWNGLSFPPPGHLLNPGIRPWSPTLQANSLPFEPPVYKLYFLKTGLAPKFQSFGINYFYGF